MPEPRHPYDSLKYAILGVDHLRELIANPTPDECINWDRGMFPDGYGAINFRRKTTRPHRVAFWIYYGYFAKPFACHTCDNRGCVNPLHLFEGTAKDNINDASRKGRLIHGDSHRMTQVFGGQKDRIIDLHKAGYTPRQIAEWLQINPMTASTHVWRYRSGYDARA